MSDAWDANTELWTKRIRAKSDLSRRFLLDPLLLQIIKSYPHSHMLDAGCGEGTFTLSMANLANAKIDAIDFSYFMCRQAQKLLEASGNHIINADLHHFPFKPSIFDLAVANMVLSGIKDIDNCFKEFTRTLKP